MFTKLRRLPRATVGRADRALPAGKARLVVAGVAVLLALASVAGVTLLASSTIDSIRTDQAGQEAMDAVIDLTPKLLSYDYETIDKDIERARSVTTGEYWSDNALGEMLKPALIKQEGSTKTVVRSAGVADAQPDRVVVLAYLNQTTEGKNLSAPRVDSRVARITAVRVDDRWLLAGFEPL